jgi:hypothetical protein
MLRTTIPLACVTRATALELVIHEHKFSYRACLGVPEQIEEQTSSMLEFLTVNSVVLISLSRLVTVRDQACANCVRAESRERFSWLCEY